jgi:hypothetical protein
MDNIVVGLASSDEVEERRGEEQDDYAADDDSCDCATTEVCAARAVV